MACTKNAEACTGLHGAYTGACTAYTHAYVRQQDLRFSAFAAHKLVRIRDACLAEP